MEVHNKIINDIAKKTLAPYGIFRKGSSRVWLDDNGYFITQIEFQPSGWSKGTFLNVGVSFLWEHSSGLNDTLPFDYGYRVNVNGKEFIEYTEDASFTRQVRDMADAALNKTLEYRKFNDLNFAKNALLKKVESESEPVNFWRVYDLAMLCFYKGDCEEGRRYFDIVLGKLSESAFAWQKEFYNHCITSVAPRLKTADSAKELVCIMINGRRRFFSEKASYKKMRKDIVF